MTMRMSSPETEQATCTGKNRTKVKIRLKGKVKVMVKETVKVMGREIVKVRVKVKISQSGLIHKLRRLHGITKAETEIQGKENLIKRDFSADKPLKKLLTDITEV